MGPCNDDNSSPLLRTDCRAQDESHSAPLPNFQDLSLGLCVCVCVRLPVVQVGLDFLVRLRVGRAPLARTASLHFAPVLDCQLHVTKSSARGFGLLCRLQVAWMPLPISKTNTRLPRAASLWCSLTSRAEASEEAPREQQQFIRLMDL